MENFAKDEKNNGDAKNIRDKKVLGLLLWETGLEFAVIMAAPLIGFIYLGKWLDSKYHQKFFVILGLFLAIALSSYLVYKKIKDLKKLLK